MGIKMNIGIIYQLGNDLTGVGKYTYNLVDSLTKISSKHTIHLICDRALIGAFDTAIHISNPFPFIKTYAWYPYMMNALKEYDLDVVHNPTQVPTLFSSSHKYVMTVHDLTPFLLPKESKLFRPLIYKLLFPRTYRSSDIIITDSNHTKRDLERCFGTNKNINVIPLAADRKYKPLDDEKILNVKLKYNLMNPYVLYVGTLEPRKNIITLLKSFYKLRNRMANYKLVIVGGRGWKYKKIFETVTALNIQSSVLFMGYVPESDLPALYNAADLFVYPSLYEGFGLPPLEAMACGTPIITSNTSSLPEVVGNAGLMIDPYNIDKLADSMYGVLIDEDLQANMIQKGINRAKMFSWERCASETLKSYENVCMR